MDNMKYVGLIAGTLIGLIIASTHTNSLYDVEVYNALPVALGMIGYGVGALLPGVRDLLSKLDRK